jgi:hypothetical protein
VTNVILRPVPDGSQDKLVELDLPHDVGVGHSFEHDEGEWVIVGEVKREDTELRVRGSGAWVATPRS